MCWDRLRGISLPGGKWIALALAFAVVVMADYAWLGATRIIDQRVGDIALRLNAQRRAPSDRVVVVDIDQRSLELMNDMAGSWPWPRSVHGELIDHLAKQAPRAMAFDVLFNEADVYRPEHDAAFAEAVGRNPNVWLAMALNNDGVGARVGDMPRSVGAKALPGASPEARVPLLLPLVVLQQPGAMRGGLINFAEDSDKVGRHQDLYLDRAPWRFASLPARIVESLGRPLPAQQRILLNWRSGWKHVSYADIYLDSLREHPQRPADEFRGKIVVVGTSAPGLQDLRLTPLGSTYPGVEVLATAIDNLDRGDWLREAPRGQLLPLALALIGLVAVAFARGQSAGRVFYAMLGVSAAVLLAAALALASGSFWPVYAPLALGWLFYILCGGIAYLQERAQRLKTASMFGRFLDPRVVADLIQRGEIDHRANAEAREISVLFTDIRGFSQVQRIWYSGR